MCGIAGIVAREGVAVEPRALAAMAAAVAHRGPDGEGVWCRENVGLAHRRLAIIDPAGGAQPMVSGDGRYVIVCNGEIYNYRELKRDLLPDYPFKTASDTEVLLAAFCTWGPACLERLDGIFAFAVWDTAEKTLYLARDLFGVKPLYWADTGKSILFGSEIKSLLAAEPSLARLSLKELDVAFTYRYSPSPGTLFENIRKVRPGHLLAVSGGHVEEKRHSRAAPQIREGIGEEEAAEETARLIAEAVERQMVADVPVGILLSGGIDSSLVASLASRHRPGLTAFTVGFAGEHAVNEIAAAGDAARHFGLRHETLELEAAGFFPVLEKMVWHLEEPAATSSAVPLYRLCEQVRRTHKVVLSGQGADEQWAGYGRHLAEGFAKALGPVFGFGPLRAASAALPGAEKLKRAFASLGDADGDARYAKERMLCDRALREKLLRSPFEDDLTHIRYHAADTAGRDDLNRHLCLDLRTQLPDDLLLYTDKVSMAHGVEVRVPLLDAALVAFVESLPSGMKLKGLKRKYLFKKVAARFIPPFVLARKKIGFETPVDTWFQKELAGPVRDLLCGASARTRPLLADGAAAWLVDCHAAGKQDLSKQVFLLLSLELWMRQFKVGV